MSNGTTSLSFEYNESGLRTKKTVGSTTHKYVYRGEQLIADIAGSDALYFRYDQNGNVLGFRRGSTEYTYVKNLQGDILAVVNSSGSVVASYTYDAWGNILTSSGTLADRNPLRYRGYVYDSETGLYYLNSRYYDPEIGRFISSDACTQTVPGSIGANMFAYCSSNPVVNADPTGAAVETVFDLLSLGFSIAEVAANPYDVTAWIGLAGDAIDLIPFVTGVGETVRGLRFVDKVGNTFEIADAVDFTEDSLKAMGKLTRKDVFTVSEKKLGRIIHDGYKKGIGFLLDEKEYRKVNGIRPDYYDGKTIFELKPFNPRSAKAGVRQLEKYNRLLGGSNVMRLEFYRGG